MTELSPDTARPDARPSAACPRAFDGAAMGLAGLCLVHCMMLPALAGILPLIAVGADAEWTHKALVALAIPLSGWAAARRFSRPQGRPFAAATVAGLALLVAGATAEALQSHETALTVAGSMALLVAHGAWWLHHRN